MANTPTPIAVSRTESGGLQISWSDGAEKRYTIRGLREACPCAHCQTERLRPKPAVLLPVISAAEARPLALTLFEPVGNYAYAIHFNDGHNSGIYTLAQLYACGTG
ncbi:MAG: DUF971 domain-containing protein [Pirellulales bacterium]|nr:DUF971 domain-containing protein [Pirellulales bacterium]